MSNNDRRSGCEARQYSDQKQCDRCGLIWDMNDDDQPECLTNEQVLVMRHNNRMSQLKRRLEL